MGRVTGYIQKFRDLRFQIPDMSNPEAFSHFVAGLNPEIRTQIGIHVARNDLEGAISMAERMDCYQQAEVRKSGQKGKFEQKNETKNQSKLARQSKEHNFIRSREEHPHLEPVENLQKGRRNRENSGNQGVDGVWRVTRRAIGYRIVRT